MIYGLCGGPLELFRRGLGPIGARFQGRSRLKAVHFLHRTAGALHRDITPQNFGFKGMPGEHLPPLQLFDMGLVYVLDTPVVESSAA